MTSAGFLGRAAPWLFLLVVACGSPVAETTSPEAFFRQGEEAARDGRWFDAAEAYRAAFALEDPVPERNPARAKLAFKRAWSLAHARRDADALAWLRWAERLDPTLRVVSYERAMLHDDGEGRVADPARAREGFRRFLDAWEEAGRPEEEARMAAHARERLEALAK